MATFKTGWMKEIINDVSTRIFAISHVKSTYYDYSRKTTLAHKLDTIDNEMNTKANINGSNASGDWNINITGNAATATTTPSADTATNAIQDKNGNDIVDTYAKKSIYNDTNISMGRKAGTDIGIMSVAYGNETTASGQYSHAEGHLTTASDSSAHAEGFFTTASGGFSHAEGCNTTASGSSAHAEGCTTKSIGDYSHAEGFNTTALINQHAEGHYNNTTNATENSTEGVSSGTAFVIGNGTPSSHSNAFRVTGEGLTIGLKAYQTGGADFSEFREWLDGNQDNEDRVGYFVTMEGKKIKKANPGDYIRGVISGNPCVIGNGDECWKQRYVLDDFGRFIYEEIESTETYIDEDGTKQERPVTIRKMKEASDYDPSQEYIPRSERKEWDCVGMVGQLSVRDDGTCQIDGFCKVADGGIATHADWSEGSYQNPVYRVVNRISENIVEIEM